MPLYANCFPVTTGGQSEAVCFTCACNIHDDCYDRCDSVKGECDLEFLEGMLSACHDVSADPAAYAPCAERAYTYAGIVVVAGQFSFNTAQSRCGAPEKFVDTPVSFHPPHVDSDRDMLPDAWEMENGLDPSNPADPNEDWDTDGLINIGEFLGGTHPLIEDSDGDRLSDGDALALLNSGAR